MARLAERGRKKVAQLRRADRPQEVDIQFYEIPSNGVVLCCNGQVAVLSPVLGSRRRVERKHPPLLRGPKAGRSDRPISRNERTRGMDKREAKKH